MECLAAIVASELIHGTGLTHGTSGNVFDNPSAPVESLLHGGNPITKFDGSVFANTGKPVARSEEANKDTIPTPRFARKSST